jgi:hypothetical protein
MGWRVGQEAQTRVEVFTLHADEDRVQVSLDEVVGLPDHLYNARGRVAIDCGAYHVHGPLWFSTGEVWQFYRHLRAAYDALTGQARFCSGPEGNLDFTLRFTSRGHWTVNGLYEELHAPYRSMRLQFVLEGDQSYLVDTLAQLADFVARYGNSHGQHT